MAHDIEPGFTGSVSSHEAPEILRATLPFRVSVKVVENIHEGKVSNRYYDWTVDLLGNQVAYRDVYKNAPRSRKAAISQARRAIRHYCDFVSTNVNKR